MTVAVTEALWSPVRIRRVPPLEPPYDDEAGPRLQLVPAHVEDLLPFDEPPPLPDVGFDRRPTPRSELPDPKPWAARLVLATLEALCGRRPVQQLMPWTDDAVYRQVARIVQHRRASSGPGVLRSLHVSEPADGVAEVCAVVGGRDRSRAVAVRLEGEDGRWRCTALQLI